MDPHMFDNLSKVLITIGIIIAVVAFALGLLVHYLLLI